MNDRTFNVYMDSLDIISYFEDLGWDGERITDACEIVLEYAGHSHNILKDYLQHHPEGRRGVLN